MEELTKDHFYNDKIIVYQGKKGFRFSVDAPILANFLPRLPDKRAVEIGCGSGIISLLALHKNKFKEITCFEIQERLSKIALLNAKENHFEKKMNIINEDFIKNNDYSYNNKFDIAFSNPPFYPVNIGRISKNKETATAKFELSITLSKLIERVSYMLKPKGDLFLILPSERFEELRNLAKKFGYSILRKRDILSFKGGKPERFLIQLQTNGNCQNRYTDEKPLIIYKQKGIYSDEMAVVLGK
jgi:tRNA1Val (adenine37-N6)-methyltransferase